MTGLGKIPQRRFAAFPNNTHAPLHATPPEHSDTNTSSRLPPLFQSATCACKALLTRPDTQTSPVCPSKDVMWRRHGNATLSPPLLTHGACTLLKDRDARTRGLASAGVGQVGGGGAHGTRDAVTGAVIAGLTAACAAQPCSHGRQAR